MDQDSGTKRETSHEEDRFWIETERQFFINPNASLIVCLRNHVWHCRHIAKRAKTLISEREAATTDQTKENLNNQSSDRVKENGALSTEENGTLQVEGGTNCTNTDLSVDAGILSTKFKIKNKHGGYRTLPFSPLDICPQTFNLANPADFAIYNEELGYTPDRQPQLAAYDEEIYYNPIVNAKHDGKLKLPVILPSQAPDGMRLILYCPEQPKASKLATGRRPGFKTNMSNDMLSPEQVPEILYGPAPVWSLVDPPTFKAGRELFAPHLKPIKALECIDGAVADPVWFTHNDYLPPEAKKTEAFMSHLALTDVSPPCPVDYSPKLFKFVETKGSPLCRRCLGMAKVACPFCRNMDINNHIPGVGFSNPVIIDHKYELVFNGIDIYHSRKLMGNEAIELPPTRSVGEIKPFKRSRDDETMSVLKEYLETLEQLDSSISTLLDRVANEKRPNFDHWSDVESRMINSYIEQYNNKMMDTRYMYNTQRQSCDVLRIRLTCPKSSKLPPQWTDHALCSVCGSDEDWDDDPILFCDCCYIPMHYCCLGYKPATMPETMKKNIRRHTWLHTPEGEEPNIDDDEWMCPCCLFLLDQLGFLQEEMALKAIRIAAGPRNKQVTEIFRSNAEQDADDFQSIDMTKLPYVLGFEYDDPRERIDLCTVYRRTPTVPIIHPTPANTDSTSGNTSDTSNANVQVEATAYFDKRTMGKLTFTKLVETGNIPTTIAFHVPDEDIEVPFEYDFKDFETDVLGRTISQFWSFKGMTKSQLEIASGVFDEILVRHMKEGNLDGMVKLLKYVAPEEEHMHSVIQQDRALNVQKTPISRRGRKPLEHKMDRSLSMDASVRTEAGNLRGHGQHFSRDDIFTMNTKNPLKRLVISVRLAKNFFVNLKIPVCIFCGFDAYYPGGGPMKRTSHMGTWGHVRCALAVECILTTRSIDYDTFVPKVKALKCMVCHNTSTAILQCSHGNCCKAFHVSCAAASSCCLFTWDQNGRPDVLCPQHASGLAPTVLLRKLQAKVQYRNYKKMSTLETSLDGFNPKDDVYLSHLLEPNYRSVASVIERILGITDKTGFTLPLCGDEIVLKQPHTDAQEKVTHLPETNGNSVVSEVQKPAPNKNKVFKRPETKLPLRDKAGKFKVSEKPSGGAKAAVVPQSGENNSDESAEPVTMKSESGTSEYSQNQSEVASDNVRNEESCSLNSKDLGTPSESSDDNPQNVKTDDEYKFSHDPNTCRITKLPKQDCFWCSIGNEDDSEASHHKAFYDDRCPSADQVGNLLFPDLAAAKRMCAQATERQSEERNIPFSGVPPLVWSEICSSSRIVDEKMLNFISDDFIGGQRLVSEVASKSWRYPLLGLTRLLNILYFKCKDANGMSAVYEVLLNYMKKIQSLDEVRRGYELGANSATGVFVQSNPASSDYAGSQAVNKAAENRKECRSIAKEILHKLNQSCFTNVNSNQLPNAILRVTGSNRSNEDTVDESFSRRFAVCSGCLEFKTIDQFVNTKENSEKCVLYAYHYKCCRVCNVRACHDCISQMKSARARFKVERMPPIHPLNDGYMSAASILSQSLYHGSNNMTMPRHPPAIEESRMGSVRDSVMPLPLMSRSQMMDQSASHTSRGMPMGTTLNVDPRMSSLMAASIAKGQMNHSLQSTGIAPRPRVGNPIPMSPNMSDTTLMQMPKVNSMPMCGVMPTAVSASVPSNPVCNGNFTKAIPGVNDKEPNSPSHSNPFGKAGPMIKSPPVKNGPYVNSRGSPQVKDSGSPTTLMLESPDEENENKGGVVITKEEPFEEDETNSENFICCRCEDMENDLNLPLLCCVLCSRFDGLLVPINREHLSFHPNWISESCGLSYVHMICLDWLTFSRAVTPALRKLPKALSESPCHYCGVACGATMMCSNNYCNVRFHASCGAWLGCKVDMGKKLESNTCTSRRVQCLRHTLMNVTRMSQAERKFLLAPPNLYELLIATQYHLRGFFSGVYLSRYCVPNKLKADPNARPVFNRPNTTLAVKRPKIALTTSAGLSNMSAAPSMLNGINYMNLGLVLAKNSLGQPISDYNMLPDNIARDRLIQALNWTAYNSMNVVGGRRDPKEIKIIIQLIKAGQLKPIHGSKRGRKPKSLDGSNFDNRQKMPMEDILTYCHSGQLDSGEFFCPVCFSIYFECSPGMPGDDLHWIGCDGCERWFHFVCAGVWAESQVDANSPSWFCLACTRQRNHRITK